MDKEVNMFASAKVSEPSIIPYFEWIVSNFCDYRWKPKLSDASDGILELYDIETGEKVCSVDGYSGSTIHSASFHSYDVIHRKRLRIPFEADMEREAQRIQALIEEGATPNRVLRLINRMEKYTGGLFRAGTGPYGIASSSCNALIHMYLRTEEPTVENCKIYPEEIAHYTISVRGMCGSHLLSEYEVETALAQTTGNTLIIAKALREFSGEALVVPSAEMREADYYLCHREGFEIPLPGEDIPDHDMLLDVQPEPQMGGMS